MRYDKTKTLLSLTSSAQLVPAGLSRFLEKITHNYVEVNVCQTIKFYFVRADLLRT